MSREAMDLAGWKAACSQRGTEARRLKVLETSGN
jgi:hypothetical protein